MTLNQSNLGLPPAELGPGLSCPSPMLILFTNTEPFPYKKMPKVARVTSASETQLMLASMKMLQKRSRRNSKTKCISITNVPSIASFYIYILT